MDEEIEEGMLVEEDARPFTDVSEAETKSPFGMLRESKSSVEEIVTKMLSIKKQAHPKSQLRELVTQMFLHFVNLRQANRSILLEEDQVKAETERAKAPVDLIILQLHNLMYEKGHYIKAIKACKDFKTKYPDIELVSEDIFSRDAPEEIKDSIRSKDRMHNLMLQRLDYELFQRKELSKFHEKLEQQKKNLLEAIANRKKFLSSLPSHLKALKKASLPVQNQLGVQHTKKLKQHQLAELLPPPLYVIYSQFLAQMEAFGEPIDLEIIGSLKDAQAFARHLANKENGISANVENSRLEDDAPEEEDDGQRRRKRPKRFTGKENPEQAGIYQVHPLKILLHIYEDESSKPKSGKLLSLKFEYLLKLNVICVGTEGFSEGPEENILCNLFPDDTGLELPHQSAKLLSGIGLTFDERRTSRPYKWAQHLGGIDFLPEVPLLVSVQESTSGETTKCDFASGLSLYRQQNRIQTVMERIRSRKKAQMALVWVTDLEQLDSLGKLRWPDLTCKGLPWALHTPSCSLEGWSLVGQHHASSAPIIETEKVHNTMDADVPEKSCTSKEDIESVREDGELPSLVSVTSVVGDNKVTSVPESNVEHSRQLAFISKSVTPQINLVKISSFRKYDEDPDLALDSDSDLDELLLPEPETDAEASPQFSEVARNSWIDYGVKEFRLDFTRKVGASGKRIELLAKMKISMEYPVRPPLLALNFCTKFSDDNHGKSEDFEWYNELRAIEAEVNLHILKMIPLDHENYVLSHQVRCLAMLFDYFVDETIQSSSTRKGTSVVDVGLCKPVHGKLLARSFRGRDRRKMISWKDMECTSAYPY